MESQRDGGNGRKGNTEELKEMALVNEVNFIALEHCRRNYGAHNVKQGGR